VLKNYSIERKYIIYPHLI